MTDTDKTRPTKPRKLSEVSQWDMETDITIVGYGGAGSCAALEAADKGSQVTIFELASAGGGSTEMSSAEIYMGGNGGTRVQKAAGFEDSTEDMFTYMMMSNGPQADEAKIRNYVENSVDHFNWLVDHGVPFKDSFWDERAIMCTTDDGVIYTGSEKAYPFAQHAKPCPRGHNLYVEGDNGGPLFMKIMKENVEANDNIEVHVEVRVLTLITDENNEIHGVVIRKDQQELCVKARKGVILCAGGFVMNDDMIKKYSPLLSRGDAPTGNPGDTGSGILMGMGVGAAAINMHEGFISLPFYPPSSLTYGIIINDKGQRFINEDVYHGRVGHAIMTEFSERFYLICTVEQYGEYEKVSFIGAPIAGTGDTIEELEKELELPEGCLQQNLEYYNKHAANGEDPLYHKSAQWLETIDAPYVALDVTPGRGAFYPYFTLGGLDTKPSGEVLTADGQVIKGLYAAGRTAAGIVRRADGYSSGMSVGDATFSGRMAGIAVAAAPSRN